MVHSSLTDFQQLVALTNAIALDQHAGEADSCILTSFALIDILRRLGHDARPIRVEAVVFLEDRRLVGVSARCRIVVNRHQSLESGEGILLLL
jgi:hypothetical protein